MKSLIVALLLVVIMTFNSFAFFAENVDMDFDNSTGLCLDQDVWVYVEHSKFWVSASTVIVHVPKHSLVGDFQNCPAQDTKAVGQGRTGPTLTVFSGMHVITLKKGVLNDSKNYTTRPPRKIEIKANNFDIWHVSK